MVSDEKLPELERARLRQAAAEHRKYVRERLAAQAVAQERIANALEGILEFMRNKE